MYMAVYLAVHSTGILFYPRWVFLPPLSKTYPQALLRKLF